MPRAGPRERSAATPAAGPAAVGGRGRLPSSSPAPAGSAEGRGGLPEESPATAQRVLEAAKRIISERGLAALTWDSVAAESGEYRSAIRYHFGDRAGLLAAVVDSTALSSGTTPLFAAVLDVEPGPRRVAVHLSALAAVSADREQFRLFWALLPHVLNDPVLGGRLASLYDGYVRINREALGAEAESAEDERRLAAVARLLTAACDGLGLMTCLPDTGEKTAEEVAAAYAVLGELVESYLWGPGAPARAQRETEGP